MADKFIYRVNYAFFRFLSHLINVVSAKNLEKFSTLIARTAYALGIRKKVVMDNLRHAFPDWNEDRIERVAKETYIHFGYIFLEFLRFPNWEPETYREKVIITTPEAFEEFKSNKNGKIVLTGHFGSWELIAAYYARFYPSAAIVKKQNNPAANDFFADVRKKSDLTIFFMKESLQLGIPWLKSGKILLIAGDQDARHHGIFVRFMGRPASTYVGAAVFAQRAQADVYYTAAVRTKSGKYELSLEKLFDVKDGFGENFIHDLIQRYMERLEHSVRQTPEQYFWLHKRWKTQPPKSNGR